MSDNPQTRATNKYHKKAYDRINLIVKKGEKEIIKTRADQLGKSVNQYISDLIKKDMGE
ncbi:MAG: antitoxin [Ruminiclostridium sp.]|nr:antitoxin [Ruminiclostridium sp.]